MFFEVEHPIAAFFSAYHYSKEGFKTRSTLVHVTQQLSHWLSSCDAVNGCQKYVCSKANNGEGGHEGPQANFCPAFGFHLGLQQLLQAAVPNAIFPCSATLLIVSREDHSVS